MPAALPRMEHTGFMKIDIPPTVIVHKYYYTGDRSFQARFLPGGPSMVVVNHPKTGERLYIPVNMLPGAPRIIYTHHAIEYDFGNQGVIIEFCWLTGRPHVEYRNHRTLASKVEKAAVHVHETAKNVAARTGFTEARQKACETARNFTHTSLDTIGTVGRGVMIPVRQVIQFVPGSQMLTSEPEDRATSLRNAPIRASRRGPSSRT